MKRRLSTLLVLAVVAACMAVPLTAQAGTRQDAAGLWEYKPTVVAEHVIGCATLLETTEEARWTGTFHGLGGPDDYAYSTEAGRVLIHCSGAMSFVAIVTFEEVTVDGRTGGLKMIAIGHRPAGEEWSGRWIALRGTGELEGLRGHGTWWGPGWNPQYPDEWGQIPYAGTIRFQ
jgi:hypothetical protein